ncbi:type III-A CRISPR-associated protein Csm2 [Streptococcus sobrinus]|uniref:CRISPR system Cms protein Csm2 n=1 Tax=Streptococcus sobrinus TaxID=1310 RepID=A0A090BCT4_9STRE|nr:type III-A CRISPR-associated protein Csm2 [Streptococcus sobrinus]OZV23410.1 type III-A CRISPR-associated protein Csm2 [Streptococcus sobrinus]BAP47533.1 CRISPR-associated protein Csm2 [Streptococcus sobrinus]BAP47546.1 CRISPR-associated protein Csm2 [Streptococcus sobrinus]
MTILTDDNYVDKAEKVIKSLPKVKSGNNELTTSKIYKLLALTSSLFDESNVKDFSQLTDKLAYLRVQFVYQAGREEAVKELVKRADILAILKEVKNISDLQRFCRYMEALVAYFKFYGGKDY